MSMQYYLGLCYTKKIFTLYQMYSNVTGQSVVPLFPGGLGETQFAAAPDSWSLEWGLGMCPPNKPPNGNQPWILIGRTNAEAPILWPPDAKSWLIGKDPDAGKDWRQWRQDEMVGWHHRQWTWVWANSGRQWRTGKPGVLQSRGVTKSQTQLSGWTTTSPQVSWFCCPRVYAHVENHGCSKVHTYFENVSQIKLFTAFPSPIKDKPKLWHNLSRARCPGNYLPHLAP